LQPCAVGVAVIATAPPPIIAARPALGFGGNDRAGGGADSRAGNRSAASPERAADNTAERPTDDRAAELAALLTLAPPAYRQSRLSKLDDCECSNGIIVHSRAKV
jgi:hypothetical protein